MSTDRAYPIRKSEPLPVHIHVGMPKTASTMLQTHLFPRHPDISYLGLFPDDCGNYYADSAVERLVHPAHGSIATTADDARVLRNHVAAARSAGKSLVVSCEGIVGGPLERVRERAEKLRESFPGGRVLMVVREPFDFLESFYFQQLKGFNQKANIYYSCREHFGPAPTLFDIDRWMEVRWENTISHALQFGEKANLYADVFGRDCVNVLSFDRLKADTRSFIGELSQWLNVDPGVSIALCDGKRSNDRFTDDHIERLKQLAGSFWLRWKFRCCRTKRDRDAMLQIGSDSRTPASPRARAQLSPHWRSVVEDFTAGELAKLKADWGIAFERRKAA